MDKKALQLICRFSLPPNSKGYCGKNSAPAILNTCIVKGKCEGVESELEKFIVLNPYLESLSEITGLKKFSYPNIEAYWLGNSYLKKAENNDYFLLLEHFSKQGVPDWLITELKAKVPLMFIPFHLFQILHVGVGRASGTLPFNLKSINNCMVRWGKVIAINKKSVKINLNTLKLNKNLYRLKQSLVSLSNYPDLIPNLQVGETVAVHWRQIIKVLTAREVANLEFWTHQTLSSITLST